MAETVVAPVTEEQKLDATVAENTPEADRTPAQKRIIQLVSRAKAAEAERETLRGQYVEVQAKLVAREKADKEAADAAALAGAKTKEDFEKLTKKLEADRLAEKAEYDAKFQKQQDAVMERAGKMILNTLAVTNGMTDPSYIRMFDCEIEIDPETLEVTPDGLKKLNTDFAAFKKANPTLFGGTTRQTIKSPDGGPAKLLTPEQKFDGGLAKSMSPIELIAAGLAKQQSGR